MSPGSRNVQVDNIIKRFQGENAPVKHGKNTHNFKGRHLKAGVKGARVMKDCTAQMRHLIFKNNIEHLCFVFRTIVYIIALVRKTDYTLAEELNILSACPLP